MTPTLGADPRVLALLRAHGLVCVRDPFHHRPSRSSKNGVRYAEQARRGRAPCPRQPQQRARDGETTREQRWGSAADVAAVMQPRGQRSGERRPWRGGRAPAFWGFGCSARGDSAYQQLKLRQAWQAVASCREGARHRRGTRTRPQAVTLLLPAQHLTCQINQCATCNPCLPCAGFRRPPQLVPW